ncbi:NmrA family transcriptional regulator [Rhizobium ruizarguesonis]|uniref:NmrA family transcriptional regulator n=1 Tax=Rhizobium ruizarguesonis TaxID=2081791 RepID=A0ABY1WYT2_9HYPH|nr:NAD(P)H-binding protein [Rhizobium ruizarguesonis]TAU15382.1 NmrA family transcriptional regulator [Rhizobium ruizarguesonis]TAU58708.1 NmrA family transcriptional regulator [Rhizobium ruizarguesonis]TAV02921.1 NmrA family transcriptional regulator [Rhizobium ruizarguesonis]TAV22059.1 NmrA family transcriptional regulator [Rhizobium ruizarguesonis]TAV22415.1 NmrA family transcriptional regulator [Rhizobium ruizarguesonis]
MIMFVIFGATGKVGKATITRLRAKGAPVRAVLRDPARAAPLAALGCEIAMAEVGDADAMAVAMRDATAVQLICPINPRAADASRQMLQSIERMAEAIDAARPPCILAISDYGAHLTIDTGITSLFRAMEERFRQCSARMVFLRSAEHMENWARYLTIAGETGVMPSMHLPLSRPFATVSAADIGDMAADLLLTDEDHGPLPRIVHGEGPREYTALDIAAALGQVLARSVVAHELPRANWPATLMRSGLLESYAELIVRLAEAHNKGLIGAEAGVGEIRRGRTDIAVALESFRPEIRQDIV